MPSPFRPARELLVQYACYHRDRRNIATHFVGIPMIIFAIGVLLARPSWGGFGTPLGPQAWTPAWVLWALTTLWYLSRGEFVLGMAVSLGNGALMALAAPLAEGRTGPWLAWGLGLFGLGWVIQFIGHYYEGKKPAFVDDIMGLIIGPLFVVAEVVFALGLRASVLQAIEARVGPVRKRDMTAGAA